MILLIVFCLEMILYLHSRFWKSVKKQTSFTKSMSSCDISADTIHSNTLLHSYRSHQLTRSVKHREMKPPSHTHTQHILLPQHGAQSGGGEWSKACCDELTGVLFCTRGKMCLSVQMGKAKRNRSIRAATHLHSDWPVETCMLMVVLMFFWKFSSGSDRAQTGFQRGVGWEERVLTPS